MDKKSLVIGVPYADCEYNSEIPCTSEGEAVAMAAGASLGGKSCLVFMQDTGFLSALNVIIGLVETYGIGIRNVIKYKSEPEHHKLTYKMARMVYEARGCNKTDIK